MNIFEAAAYTLDLANRLSTAQQLEIMDGIDRDHEIERGIRVRQGVRCADHTKWPDVADRVLDRVRGDVDTDHEDTGHDFTEVVQQKTLGAADTFFDVQFV